ncbi:hypothetical protein [Litoribacterium kuwaitense]|nr:hypothetical protein [Litoribacterium kuwaitense]
MPQFQLSRKLEAHDTKVQQSENNRLKFDFDQEKYELNFVQE